MSKSTAKSFLELLREFERDKVKRRLKAAFRRTPRPAKPKPQAEDKP